MAFGAVIVEEAQQSKRGCLTIVLDSPFRNITGWERSTYNPVIFLISLSLLSASIGVRELISSPLI